MANHPEWRALCVLIWSKTIDCINLCTAKREWTRNKCVRFWRFTLQFQYIVIRFVGVHVGCGASVICFNAIWIFEVWRTKWTVRLPGVCLASSNQLFSLKMSEKLPCRHIELEYKCDLKVTVLVASTTTCDGIEMLLVLLFLVSGVNMSLFCALLLCLFRYHFFCIIFFRFIFGCVIPPDFNFRAFVPRHCQSIQLPTIKWRRLQASYYGSHIWIVVRRYLSHVCEYYSIARYTLNHCSI